MRSIKIRKKTRQRRERKSREGSRKIKSFLVPFSFLHLEHLQARLVQAAIAPAGKENRKESGSVSANPRAEPRQAVWRVNGD